MKFHEYLKSCRKKYRFTQEQFVQELYNFDDSFVGMDTRTLSRWESAHTQPSLARQVVIMKFLQTLSGDVLSCFEDYDAKEIEESICRVGVSNIVGKNKELVLNFPSSYIIADNLKITYLKESHLLDTTLKVAIAIDNEFTNNYSQLQEEDLKKWLKHPSSFFLICEYEGQLFGHLFTLKLKPEIFEKVINFEMHENELKSSHFAEQNEDGCSYFVGFFAHSQKAASLLFLRYYAHLIVNQRSILKVGAYTMMSEIKKLLGRIHLLPKTKTEIDKQVIFSYDAPLDEVLINEAVLGMIFKKEDCPEG